MMKFLNKKAPWIYGLAFVVVFFTVPHVAHAVNLFDVLSSPVLFVTKLWSAAVELVLIPLAAGILWIAGYTLDTAIQFSLNTAYIFSFSKAIDLGWVIIRDIANIFFIFILIYISLGTIVNGLGFGTKKMLKDVVVAALLINFSLFVTKAVIDVSNIFGQWLYGGVKTTLIVNSSCSNGGTTTDKCTDSNTTGLTSLIVSRMGLVHLWEDTTSNTTGNDIVNKASSQTVLSSYIRLMVVLMLTYVFIYATILFLTRAITLLFLLVFSPIGFMGNVLPGIGDYAKEWRSELTKAAVFPIVFLLMLYIALQFINSLGSITLPAYNIGAGSSSFTSINLTDLFQYFLIIFILMATLKISKKYAGELGDKAEGLAKSLGQLAISASAGVAGFAGRRVIGSLAAKASENAWIQDAAAGKVGGNVVSRFAFQTVGKGALGTARGTAKSSFDFRGSDTLQNMSGINLGKAGGKDGFKGMVKAQEEKEKKYAEEFGDTPEGIERRLAYASDRKNSILTNFMVGSKAAGKVGGTIRSEAGLASVKSETNEAQKALQEAKNQIVEEAMAQKILDKANKSDNPRDINRTLEGEALRADNLMKAIENDPKKRLAYNRYLRTVASADPNRQDEVRALDEEFEAATKNMIDKDKEELIKKTKEGTEEIEATARFVADYKHNIGEAIRESDIKTKKGKIDALREMSKGRVGERSGWDPKAPSVDIFGNPTGKNNGKSKEDGTGLTRNLEKKRDTVLRARAEQAILEGKGKIPKTGKTSGPAPDEDEDEEGGK